MHKRRSGSQIHEEMSEAKIHVGISVTQIYEGISEARGMSGMAYRGTDIPECYLGSTLNNPWHRK